MKTLLIAVGLSSVFVSAASAQVQPPPAPWRGAGPTPCVGSDKGVYKCVPPPGTVAIRAGRLFDATTGQMLTRRVVVIVRERGGRMLSFVFKSEDAAVVTIARAVQPGSAGRDEITSAVTT